ncbi:hypothetical protein Tco_0929802 [Tanacetum coccineum]
MGGAGAVLGGFGLGRQGGFVGIVVGVGGRPGWGVAWAALVGRVDRRAASAGASGRAGPGGGRLAEGLRGGRGWLWAGGRVGGGGWAWAVGGAVWQRWRGAQEDGVAQAWLWLGAECGRHLAHRAGAGHGWGQWAARRLALKGVAHGRAEAAAELGRGGAMGAGRAWLAGWQGGGERRVRVELALGRLGALRAFWAETGPGGEWGALLALLGFPGGQGGAGRQRSGWQGQALGGSGGADGAEGTGLGGGEA